MPVMRTANLPFILRHHPCAVRIGFAMLAASLAGCAVPVHQQRLVSRPSMQFSDTAVSGYQSKVLGQIETGAAASGGAQAAGCTSCR